MKKFLIITISIITVGVSLTGCLKDTFATNLYATGNPLLEFEYPQGGGGVDIGSGLEYFGGGSLLYPPTDITDTAMFIVNLASTNTLSKSLSVTVFPDTTSAALEANYSNDSINYLQLPDSDYQLLSPTGTIQAGQRQDTFYIVFYPSKINFTINYGLPITVSDAQGVPTSGNFGHIYFHVIGNLLAGVYSVAGVRDNYVGSSGWGGPPAAIPAPASSTDLGAAIGFEAAAPDNGSTIELGYSNLGSSGDNLVITYNNDPASPAISVAGNSTLVGGVANFKVEVETITVDPVSGKATLHIVSSYTNGAGNDRINDETFVQQ
jgi:Domain of unknown function (DUF1735)